MAAVLRSPRSWLEGPLRLTRIYSVLDAHVFVVAVEALAALVEVAGAASLVERAARGALVLDAAQLAAAAVALARAASGSFGAASLAATVDASEAGAAGSATTTRARAAAAAASFTVATAGFAGTVYAASALRALVVVAAILRRCAAFRLAGGVEVIAHADALRAGAIGAATVTVGAASGALASADSLTNEARLAIAFTAILFGPAAVGAGAIRAHTEALTTAAGRSDAFVVDTTAAVVTHVAGTTCFARVAAIRLVGCVAVAASAAAVPTRAGNVAVAAGHARRAAAFRRR